MQGLRPPPKRSPRSSRSLHWARSVQGSRPMSSRRTTSGDLLIAAVSIAFGALAIGVAYQLSRAPFVMLPSLDGALTVGVVGVLLALAGGLPYRRALLLLSPVLVAQLVAARLYSAPFL